MRNALTIARWRRTHRLVHHESLGMFDAYAESILEHCSKLVQLYAANGARRTHPWTSRIFGVTLHIIAAAQLQSKLRTTRAYDPALADKHLAARRAELHCDSSRIARS